jgi:hypothetical protein
MFGCIVLYEYTLCLFIFVSSPRALQSTSLIVSFGKEASTIIDVFMCMHAGKHATNSNTLGCIALVQMHVMFVDVRFMAACASISPFVRLPGCGASCVCLHTHTLDLLYSFHYRVRFIHTHSICDIRCRARVHLLFSWLRAESL